MTQQAAGLLARLTAAWAARRQAAAGPDPADAGIDPRLAGCADRVCTAAEAVARIQPGDHVFVGSACATPRALVAALEALRPTPADVELVHFLTDHAVAHDAEGQPLTRFRHRSFFVGQDMRSAVRRGLADYVPISLARVPELIAIGRVRVDVALIQVSMPDDFGYVSLGISVDVIPAALKRARLVIAEVNPAMPRSMGDSMLHVGEIDHLVPIDTPVIEYQHPTQPGPVVESIARYIGSIIDDGSTLQIGMGRFSNEALKYLSDRRDLAIHSDVITDAIIPLLEKGILTGKRKSNQPGKIVCSFAMGSRRLYELIDGNPLFSFQPIEAVCDAWTVSRQHKMVSVTQAFSVDLSGQVCADQFGGDFYGGLAAQSEFLQGASRSPGGKAVICLASTDAEGQVSRIRAVLPAGEGATIARSDVHYVITEYGIAHLFGKSIRERAIALIQIAHPEHRPALFEQAQQLGYLPAEQKLRNLRAYAVEEERQVMLKDRRELLLRPAGAADGDAVRELFHRMPERDVYTRFFRKIRGLSIADVQRLCNVNGETEVAVVAVTGSREDPQVVAHALYVLDPSTNLAETAFIVHPDWQGSGLGSQLQQQLALHARAAGVRGFVAEILPTNEQMIRLARQGSSEVSTEQMDGTVRVTTLF
ncbi:bifunctional acetyl-CoA hydrolase/transferase family protein/GNAT family N-acetyltransferase [Roseateles violae]|uniref:GNAT family N-acetyltransferase n=1 Tax=Roseateles violae TaxID=3058042 RepID=A0ABT8DZX2_9BURK|nr:bifunctional acetyl-CoA hydrolase/transferase family protein/GNAT family N-acetyltransferase [Pelomonas sp. PFR6]MDN3923112.1 GNAT family N-acetyltransferase [Pelomonas sp. PFR6]